ncbi:uroporphyrinogen-III C-methyltransferase [soil metagenome]
MAKAYLVGAGPGDPRLLTIAALEALQCADVILCDRLVSDHILALANPLAQVVYVGKHAGEQATVQAQIFEHFENFYCKDIVLVRLKGGDPYVFGRGSEEHIVLKQLGYDVTMIPGISSALGVPGLAGIPITARGVSASFAVVTGHCCTEEQFTWSKVSQVDTLVVLMGVSERVAIATALIQAGRDPFEPISFVENGSTENERIIRANLREVAEGLVEVSAPAIFVIGAVTRIYQQWENAAVIPQAETTLNISALISSLREHQLTTAIAMQSLDVA